MWSLGGADHKDMSNMSLDLVTRFLVLVVKRWQTCDVDIFVKNYLDGFENEADISAQLKGGALPQSWIACLDPPLDPNRHLNQGKVCPRQGLMLQSLPAAKKLQDYRHISQVILNNLMKVASSLLESYL